MTTSDLTGVAMTDWTVQELIEAARCGNDKARRVAWARVIEARKVLDNASYTKIAGDATLNQLRATIKEATISLKAIRWLPIAGPAGN